MLANAAAMNYGFAFRIANYAALRQIAADVFGGTPGQLVVDSPHNSIYEEEVGGKPAVVHRHNSCRAYPAELMPAGTTFAETGQAVLVPGHPPDVVLPVRGGRIAGRAVLRLPWRRHRRLGLRQARDLPPKTSSSAAPCGSATTTRRRPRPRTWMTRASTKFSAVLVRGGLVRPVARMRPFAVLH